MVLARKILPRNFRYPAGKRDFIEIPGAAIKPFIYLKKYVSCEYNIYAIIFTGVRTFRNIKFI